MEKYLMPEGTTVKDVLNLNKEGMFIGKRKTVMVFKTRPNKCFWQTIDTDYEEYEEAYRQSLIDRSV